MSNSTVHKPNGVALLEMAQGNVELYSVHTNGVALRRIVLQNIRRSSSILNCLALHALIGLPNKVFAIKAFRYHFD